MPQDSKAASGVFDLRGAVKLDIVADPKSPGSKKTRRFTIEAYTGVPLKNQWDKPVVVDLEGIVLGNGIFPILDGHLALREAVVGESETAAIENGKLILRGKIFDTDPSTQICALADQGFHWQASIGAQTTKKEFVGEGVTCECNGQTYEGPIYISRVTELRETSFVVIGDDANTSALVAAIKGKRIRAMKMTFKEFCAANGHEDTTKMTAAEKAEMQDKYCAADGGTSDEENKDDEEDDEDTEAEGETDDEDTEAEGETDDEEKKKNDKQEAAAKINIKPKGGDMPNQLKAYRQQNAKEERRLRKIREITASAPDLKHEITVNGKKKTVNIREHAIAAGWTPERTAPAFELAQLRASRAGGDGADNVPITWYSPSQPQLTEAVLESAVLQAGQCRLFDSNFWDATNEREAVPMAIRRPAERELKARYTDQVQQNAHDLFKGRIGLQQLLAAAAMGNGKRIKETIRDDLDLEAALRAQNWIRGEGFSTVSLPNVLANVLNKFMLQGYLFAEMAWREICAIRPVKDFKPTKSINLFSNDGAFFMRVGADGALKHAALSDQAFANQVFTEGRLIVLNRQTIINDDLNMLTGVPMLIGRGAMLRLNFLFWTQFLATTTLDDNGVSNFWSATHVDGTGASVGNTNLISGATSAMSSAGLQAGELTFDKQIGPDKQPLGINPSILLFPPDVKVSAWELMNSEFLIYGGQTASKQPQKNRFVGAYKPVMSRYLSNPSFTGYSTTAWYLLSDPGFIPVIEMAFLNGQETPTVQTAQANFNILGIEIRGFFDIGVNSQNFRGGVKSLGA